MIIPFDNLVLVEVLKKEEKKSSVIFMPEGHIGRYMRYKILNLGPTVSWVDQVKVGDVVIGNPTNDEELEPNIKLINSKDIFAKEVND